MKRFVYIIILATICGMTAMAQDRPDITRQTSGGNHEWMPTHRIHMPTINYDEESCTITIIGDGASGYYLVDVINTSTGVSVLSTMIDGNVGVIDATMLLDDSYLITITDDKGVAFSYLFDGALHTSSGSGGSKPANSTSIVTNIVDKNKLK